MHALLHLKEEAAPLGSFFLLGLPSMRVGKVREVLHALLGDWRHVLQDLGAYGSWQEIVQKDKDGKWKKTGIVVPDIYIDHALDNAKK
jgi:hypothetical protein